MRKILFLLALFPFLVQAQTSNIKQGSVNQNIQQIGGMSFDNGLGLPVGSDTTRPKFYQRGAQVRVNQSTNGVEVYDTVSKLWIAASEPVLKAAGFVTPEMYGAKGDGSTDDAAAIQKMIDDIDSSGICQLFLPKTYITGSTILATYSNVNIRGLGDAIIKRKDSSLVQGVDITNGRGCVLLLGNRSRSSGWLYRSNVNIEGLTIDGNVVNQPLVNFTAGGFGIYALGVDGLRITNCNIINNSGTGIALTRVAKSLITGCRILNNGTGLTDGSKNGISYSGALPAFTPSGTIPSEEIYGDHICTGNIINGNQDVGVMFGGVWSVNISNNILRDNIFSAIEGDSQFATDSLNTPRNVVIRGNHIVRGGGGMLISCGTEQNVIISDNEMRDLEGSAIYVNQTIGGIYNISNNIIENYLTAVKPNGYHGVLLSGDNIKFTGNSFKQTKPMLTPNASTVVIFRAKNIDILNNTFDSTANYVIQASFATQTDSVSFLNVKNNTFNTPQRDAILIQTSGGKPIKNVTIQDNSFFDVGRGFNPSCITFSNTQPISEVNIIGNTERDTRAVTSTNSGVLQNSMSTIGTLRILDNNFNQFRSVGNSVFILGTVNSLNRQYNRAMNKFPYSGSTSNRPTPISAERLFYWNTTTGTHQYWNGTSWGETQTLQSVTTQNPLTTNDFGRSMTGGTIKLTDYASGSNIPTIEGQSSNGVYGIYFRALGANDYTSSAINFSSQDSAGTGEVISGKVFRVANYSRELAHITSQGDFKSLYNIYSIRSTFGNTTTAPTHSITVTNSGNGYADYNTSTTAPDNERFTMGWNSNVFQFGTSAAGTGSTRPMSFLTNGITRLSINQAPTLSGSIVIPGTYSGTGLITQFATGGTYTNTSGINNMIATLTTINQSGTAGFRAAWISPFISGSGSGIQYLIDAGINSAAGGLGTHTSRFTVDVNGLATATQFKLSALNTAPASATDTGVTGEIRIVNGFIYVCVATNTWQRTALATW